MEPFGIGWFGQKLPIQWNFQNLQMCKCTHLVLTQVEKEQEQAQHHVPEEAEKEQEQSHLHGPANEDTDSDVLLELEPEVSSEEWLCLASMPGTPAHV